MLIFPCLRIVIHFSTMDSRSEKQQVLKLTERAAYHWIGEGAANNKVERTLSVCLSVCVPHRRPPASALPLCRPFSSHPSK